jgi:fatty-acyl-CoA synthase
MERKLVSEFESPRPGEVTNAALLMAQAARIPDGVYGIFPNREVTFGELHREAMAVAKGLIALGIRPGDHVATLMPNHPHWLPAYFGILYAGATIVALNARYKRQELEYVIPHSDARLLLTTDAIDDHVDFATLLAEVLPGLAEAKDAVALDLPSAPDLRAVVMFGTRRRAGFLPLDDLVERGRNISDDAVRAAAAAIGPEDPAAIIYTSGTTSNPKGCVLSHAGLQRSWYTFAEVVNLAEGEKVWMPMPFFHTGGIGPMTAMLSRGAAFMTQPHLDPEAAVALVEKYRIDHLYSGFPQLSFAVLDHPTYDRERFGFVRTMLNVGPPAMQERIQSLLPEGGTVLNLFGMTEGSGIVTFTPLDSPMEIRAVTSGKAPAHTEVRIVDPETGALCGPDAPGEIQFRGGGALKAYYKDPEATRATILPGGWVRTGDRGRIDADGWLHFLGRLKDMLKVGGENVAAAEIEFFLTQHPEVKMVQVVGGADARMGEVPVAFVERLPGGTVTGEELMAMCQGQLARWKIPAEVVFVTDWPMSATKVQKFRLKEQLPKRFRA